MGDDDPVAIRRVQFCVDAAGKGKSQGKIESKTSDIAEVVDLEVDPGSGSCNMARSSCPLMPAMTCPVFSSRREAIVPPVVIKLHLVSSRFVH